MEIVWTTQTAFIQIPLAWSPEPVFVFVPPNEKGSARLHQGDMCHKGVDPSGNGSDASSSASLGVKWKLLGTQRAATDTQGTWSLSVTSSWPCPVPELCFVLALTCSQQGLPGCPSLPSGEVSRRQAVRCSAPLTTPISSEDPCTLGEVTGPHSYLEQAIASPSLRADASQPL